MAGAKRWGPKQLRDALGLLEWQFGRARTSGDIPAPDLDGGKWSAAVVEVLVGKRGAIAERAGSTPDCGGHAAADYLSARLGVDVPPHVIPELARVGLLRRTDFYKGHQMYDGRQLETFDDLAAIAKAEADGRMLTMEQVTERLGVRPSDTAWLLKLGWLKASSGYRGQWSSWVQLFRAGDVTGLLDNPEIDWDAVRAAPRGRASVLARLEDRTVRP